MWVNPVWLAIALQRDVFPVPGVPVTRMLGLRSAAGSQVPRSILRHARAAAHLAAFASMYGKHKTKDIRIG